MNATSIQQFRGFSRKILGEYPISPFHVLAPRAPGSSPISGRLLSLCNPNLLTYPSILPTPLSSVYSLTRYIMLTKIITSRERRETRFSLSPLLSAPSLKSSFHFSSSNLNLHLALLFAIFPAFFPVLLWLVELIFVYRSTFQSEVTDKGKPFERMGRKTSDLSNGGWVAEVAVGSLYSPILSKQRMGFLFAVHLIHQGGQP